APSFFISAVNSPSLPSARAFALASSGALRAAPISADSRCTIAAKRADADDAAPGAAGGEWSGFGMAAEDPVVQEKRGREGPVVLAGGRRAAARPGAAARAAQAAPSEAFTRATIAANAGLSATAR